MAVGVNVAVGLSMTVGKDVCDAAGESVVAAGVIPATPEEDGEEDDNGVVGIITFGRTLLLLLPSDSVLFLGETVAGTAVVGDTETVAGTAVVGDPDPALLPSLAVVLLFCFLQSGL